MRNVTVQVDPDHYQHLFGTPKAALVELIRNGLDADASQVSVTFERNALGGIEKVVVTDDGSALQLEDVDGTFGKLGGSWKATAKSTGQGRELLGKQGKGRFAAFSLGTRVEWRFVTCDGPHPQAVTLSAASSNPGDVSVVSGPATGLPPGAQVSIWNVPEAAVSALESSRLRDAIVVELAPYLIKFPDVHVNIEGNRLDPVQFQQRLEVIDLDVANTDEPVQLQIIEWSRDFGRDLHLCGSDGVTRHSTPPGIQAPGYHFTGYLRWDGFVRGDAVLADLGQEPGASVVEAAKDALRTYFRQRSEETRARVIPAWIEEGVYPFEPDSDAGPAELSERAAFDQIAVVASQTINEGSTRNRKLSLLLLKEALESRPGSLHTILREVLNLTPKQVDEFAQMLEHTTLGAIIRTSRLISDRLTFLSSLTLVVADPASRRSTLERKQLHRILASESWVFAEEYALIGDDQRLQEVLRAHLARLGEDIDLYPGPVGTRPDGTGIVPDLVFSGSVARPDAHVHNVVVELKRPSVNVGVDEWRQIEDYALAVTRDVRFNQPNVTWEFWVVGNEVRPEVRALTGDVRERIMTTVAGGLVTLRARTWAEVISEAEHRLKFVEGTLDFQVTQDGARSYLQQHYADYLPDVLRPGEDRPES